MVGDCVGALVVGDLVGIAEGILLGLLVVGEEEGKNVGARGVGDRVGVSLGAVEGLDVAGLIEGLVVVGLNVGLDVVGIVEGLDVVGVADGLDVVGIVEGLDVVGIVDGLDVVGVVEGLEGEREGDFEGLLVEGECDGLSVSSAGPIGVGASVRFLVVGVVEGRDVVGPAEGEDVVDVFDGVFEGESLTIDDDGINDGVEVGALEKVGELGVPLGEIVGDVVGLHDVNGGGQIVAKE